MMLFSLIFLLLLAFLLACIIHFLGRVKLWKAFLVSLIALILLINVLRSLNSKTVLDKEDYYGTYVVNRKMFRGEQADWQYNTFRFEIRESDSIYFYVTDEEKILKTYKGVVKTTNPDQHPSARLIIEMEEPTHHILSSNPTTYRDVWDFYLAFESPKFYNVFFKKGEWVPIK